MRHPSNGQLHLAVRTNANLTRATDLTQPEVVLPEQFFSARRNANSLGELRLLCAILEDAVHCFQTYVSPRTARQRRLFHDAERWLMRGRTHYVFDRDRPRIDFEYVCGVLDLNPAYIRDGLQRWRQQQLAETTTPPQLSVSASAF